MVPVLPFTLHFIEAQEGVRLDAYWDSYGEVWTIGPGMTTIHGRPVREGDTLTQAECDQLFRAGAQSRLDQLMALIRPDIRAKLTLNQITALLSLVWNIGMGGGPKPGFKESQVLAKLNMGDFKGAANAFLNWTRSGNNRTLLLPRRQRERSLFLS